MARYSFPEGGGEKDDAGEQLNAAGSAGSQITDYRLFDSSAQITRVGTHRSSVCRRISGEKVDIQNVG
jgi:hypothetical protein